MLTIHHILKEHWGFETFRPLQQGVIEAVLEGKDVLALMPTGGGKSLCYQVPALAQEGICLVVSPLIALMKDQIENLRTKGIMALGIYTGMTKRAIAQTLKNAAYGDYKFLYVSPERLETALFLEFLPALNINLIAVDEAHCISQWGYDFRPAYLRIATLREQLPRVPVLALTASATPAVQKDICNQLLFQNPMVLQQSFARPNLSYSVLRADGKNAKLADVVQKVGGTAIVYCKSRKRTSEVAALLQMHGVPAQYYHAGLSSEERSKRQQAWMENKTRVIVCTTAFGMGIDKPDVRLVIHADAPDSLEGYYQEAGRAGRDGKKAYAVLLYSDKDLAELQALHTARFPTLDAIRKVYSALVNFLQIPVYTGEDQAFTFHFQKFIQQFGLSATLALYSLKALESDGWLLFSEKTFTPSTVTFTTSKSNLNEYVKVHPQHQDVLTTLLRTYEGIYDYPVFVSELTLAKLLRTKEETVKTALQQLSANRIIAYTPQTDEPQIIFRKNRVAAADLLFNTAAYNKRKDAFVQRTSKMVQYIQALHCRSTFINTYFGAPEKDCRICDNCLRLKNTILTEAEFKTIHEAIIEQLKEGPMAHYELLKKLGVPKEKAWKVLHFLQAQNKIEADGYGLLKKLG